MESDFIIQRDGTTLRVVLGKELSMTNSKALTDALYKYYGQGIEKVVFDATELIYLSSSGLRTVVFANQRLGGKNEIVFVNCAKEIYGVLDHVGMTSVITFEEDQERRKEYRRDYLSNMDDVTLGKQIKARKESLENYTANNDVVCYTMKMGQSDD